MQTTIKTPAADDDSLFESAFRFAAIGMALVDNEGKYLKVNRAMCELVGYDEAELLGLRFADITHPDDLERNIALAERLKQGDMPTYRLEKRYVHKEGHTVWVLMSTSVMLVDDGKPSYYIVQNQDISRRRQAEGQRDLFFDMSVDLLCILDKHGRVVGNNRAWTMLGWQPEEWLGRNSSDLVHPDELGWVSGKVEDAFRKGIDAQFTCRSLCKDGSYSWIEWSMRASADGFAYGIGRDISDRRERERTLRLQEQAMESASNGIIITRIADDGQRSIVYCNEAVERITGYARHELIGRDPGILHRDDGDQPGLRELADHLRSGDPCEVVVRNYRKDGSRFFHKLAYNPVKDDAGRVTHTVAVTEDITERLKWEETMRLQERALASTISGIVILDVTDGGKIVFCNPAYASMAGYEPEELIGRNVHEALHKGDEDQPGIRQLIKAASTGESATAVLRTFHRDGTVFHKRVHFTPVPEPDGSIRYYIGSEEDISDSLRAEAALHAEKEWLGVTLRSIGDAVLSTDTEGRVTFLNPVAEQLTGWTTEEAAGHPVSDVFRVVEEEDREPVRDLIEQVLRNSESLSSGGEVILLHRDGQEFAIEESAAPIRGAADELIGTVLVFRDVTEARARMREISHRAVHDPLTGLVNRYEFERRLEYACKTAWRAGAEYSLLYIDLDRFKLVNDSCGHMAGDELLRQLADSLRTGLRSIDTVARLGGDEFGVLLENCSSESAAAIAETLREEISRFDFVWDNKHFGVGASIGVITFRDEGWTLHELLRTVDSACYIAKERGRNRVHVSRPDDAELTARIQETDWAERLQNALREDRLILYSQRIAPLNDSDVPERDRREILLRLRGEDGSIIPPMAFIPAAERFDLMPMIDRWVIKAVLEHLSALSTTDRASKLYSVNLSGLTLNDDGFPRFVKEQIAAYDVAPWQICFEVTETAAIADLAQTGRLVRELKELGFRFALDDFGSGMSSFSYLKQLPVDFLKIDGVFIRDLLNDPVDRAMVEAVARVARVMGLRTIAEYVEDDAVWRLLREIGVDYGQGFGIHRPEPLVAG